MDVDSIEPGLDFFSILENQVANCEILLALIGRGWLSASDEEGRRRLANPSDFVRIEIASALAQGKRIIPVLIGPATMPRDQDLPEELKPLARRQAFRLTHENFNADVERLIRVLSNALTAAEEQAQRKAEEKRQRAEAETQRKAEAQRQAEEERRRAEAQDKRNAEELKRKRQEQDEAEGRRQAEEKERQWRERRSAEVKRQVAEEEDRRRPEAETKRKAKEERQRAFATWQAENEKRHQEKPSATPRTEEQHQSAQELARRTEHASHETLLLGFLVRVRRPRV